MENNKNLFRKKPKLSIAQLARDAGVPWWYVNWRVVNRTIPAPTEPIIRGRNKVYSPEIYDKCLEYLRLCIEQDKLKNGGVLDQEQIVSEPTDPPVMPPEEQCEKSV